MSTTAKGGGWGLLYKPIYIILHFGIMRIHCTSFTSLLFLGSTPSLANQHVELHVTQIFWHGADQSGLHNNDVNEMITSNAS